jgi:hypothetical protein
MKKNPIDRPTSRAPAGALALLALLALTTGAALAADPASMTYHFSSHPMISGTVVAVNDHQMVVNTDQGEQVTLELDTRTMAPRDLGPGMVVRADFKALEDCRFYAQAITPLRGSDSPERTQAYANTHDSPEVVARNATAEGSGNAHVPAEAAATGARVTSQQEMGEHSSGTTMSATPSTSDYVHSTRPMVSGRVIAVNDHRLVVRTDQGQRVGMVMDSQTMIPRDVAPDAYVRSEFTRLKDGRYYARSVDLVDDQVAAREQAYAHTIDAENVAAQDVQDCGAVFAGDGNTMTTVIAPRSTPPAAERGAEPAATPTARELPQTASGRPLLLLLGSLALAAALAVRLFAGSRAA